MNYAKIRRKIKLKNYFNDFLLMIIGCLIMALGTSFFLLPNQLSSGGFTGISTIFFYLLKFPVGTTMFILNIPLFILGYIRLGKNFIIKSIAGTTILSIFLNMLERVPLMMQDKFLASIYGGIIVGIGIYRTARRLK